MTTAPKISVIVPVYNVATYVGECLSSLVHQTFTDFEIIAINDGSTDGSLAILREFEASYPFVHVIDQPNGGVSKARQAGLSCARGEYIAFVDSDDYVVPNFLEGLYNALCETGADISCCNYHLRFEVTGFTMTYPFCWKSVLTREKAMCRLIRDYSIQGFLWNKLYRKTLFTEHQIHFPTMCFEDMVMNHQLFSHADKIATIRTPLYYYQQRHTSALNTMNAKKINDYLQMLMLARQNLEKMGEFKKYEFSYQVLCTKTAFCAIYFIIKMHLDRKSLSGMWTNIKNASKTVLRFVKKDFDPNDNSKVNAVDPPKAESKYSTH